MLLLFDPQPPKVGWAVFDADKKIDGGVLYPESNFIERILKQAVAGDAVETIGYFLYHGGGQIVEPVSIISAPIERKIERCIKYLPESNGLIHATVRECRRRFPQARHVLLCDTALFSHLPEVASTYAIPQTLRFKEVKRFGGFGIYHQWAWEKLRSITGTPLQRVVSVHLGDQTNITALSGGRPIDTTMGFSPMEGIPSTTSCGDIDPSIVFEILANGVSLNEINDMLMRKSGFSGLLKRKSTYLDVIGGADGCGCRDLLRYHILRYLGAFLALLDGADALIFITDHLDESLPFIQTIMEGLDFLGIKMKDDHQTGAGYRTYTREDSAVKAYGVPCDKWSIMEEKIQQINERRT